MLKIYTYDLGWAGGLIVTATSQEEAKAKMLDMSDDYGYAIADGRSDDEIEEHDLEGFTFKFYGDQ